MSTSLKALIVDDDPICLVLMEAILLRLGVDVTTSDDSRRALATILAEPDRFDLLVTDYQMPGLDGAELVGFVSQKLPELPIVLVSSRVDEALKRIDSKLLDAHVAKPFGELELSAALCQALDVRNTDGAELGIWVS